MECRQWFQLSKFCQEHKATCGPSVFWHGSLLTTPTTATGGVRTIISKVGNWRCRACHRYRRSRALRNGTMGKLLLRDSSVSGKILYNAPLRCAPRALGRIVDQCGAEQNAG